ncbi:MAG: alpha/beta fold hydrolase [Ilumatobacteraceae bacterium]
MIVRSSDGVEVAVHDLAGHDGDRPVLLISHATGFHGYCYQPFARALATRFHSIAFDYRGHGDTPQPAHVDVDWNRYADDSEAVALSLTRPLAAFGHSMGGACLLITAHRHPDLFSHLVLYEPIVFSPDVVSEGGSPQLADGARRRRSVFESFDAAYTNFASKPPLDKFTPDALAAYVRHGFREGEDGQIHLKCRPEQEAATFEMALDQDTWDLLPEITVPVVVICGALVPDSPARHSRPVAERLPNGTYLQVDELDHFGPMTHPEMLAALVAAAL